MHQKLLPNFRSRLTWYAALYCCATLAAPLPAATDGGAASFSANASLVIVPVTVTDRNGKTITDLKREQFQVSDGSTPREIVSFGFEDAPVSLGIVLDLSTSMQRKLPYALSAAKSVIEQLGPDDSGYVVTFDHRPRLHAARTKDHSSLANSLLFSTAAGNTALYDAVHLGLQQGRGAKDARKVLVVISDGGDNRSRLRESELVSEAIEADTQIYCISVHERLRARDEVAGARFLQSLSERTGGLFFDLRTRDEIPVVAEAIGRAMKDQYVIGFKPIDENAPARWRKMRIQLDLPDGRKLRVNAPRAYYNP